MLKRFIVAFLAFIGVIVPGAFLLALLMAPPSPAAPLEPQGCERNVANATASVAAMQARVKSAGAETCNITRLYFLEVVKARAVIALCKTGPDRERELGRFDADVEHINEAIATSCR